MSASAEPTTESAQSYLTQHSVKSLLEWLTAELILNRPVDPFTFLRDALTEKVQERGDGVYNASDTERYVQEVYEKASGSADETGRLRQGGKGGGFLSSASGDGTDRLVLLENLLSAARSISTKLDPFEAHECIIKECMRILGADRATLFQLDSNANELEILVAKGVKSIKLPMGVGIAGSVAETGETINIPDAYEDSRFNPQSDRETGYKTKSILCHPVRNAEGATVGVIQAINSKNGVFSAVDEEVVDILATQAGIALNNAILFTKTERAQEKIRSLLEIIKVMHGDMGINSLIFTVTQRAPGLVSADRCTLYLADHSAKELWSLQGENNIRMPIDKGFAGKCATTNAVVNIHDAYQEPSFNRDFDKKTGYRTKTILCMPIRGNDGTVVGVIQLINKEDSVFDRDDEDVMDAFLSVAGPIIQTSQLFARSKKAEVKSELEGKSLVTKSSKPAGVTALIEEDEDEEDEED